MSSPYLILVDKYIALSDKYSVLSEKYVALVEERDKLAEKHNVLLGQKCAAELELTYCKAERKEILEEVRELSRALKQARVALGWEGV